MEMLALFLDQYFRV